MRGKDRQNASNGTAAGITPAYAGKRISPEVMPIRSKDHPRLCGEKWTQISVFAPAVGSPPPMRGKVFCALAVFICVRITPAYAGKSGIRKS